MNRVSRVPLTALVLLLALLGGSCLSRRLPEVSYYLLEYQSATENSALRLEEPVAGMVHIEKTDLPRAFVRRQIVNRLEGQEYRYLRDHMWGDDLSEAIPRLLESRMRVYNIFSRTSRDFGRNREGYLIRSRLDRIEFVRWGDHSEALVELEFTLVDLPTGAVLARHAARRSLPVADLKVGAFVPIANQIILAEIDLFLESVEKALDR